MLLDEVAMDTGLDREPQNIPLLSGLQQFLSQEDNAVATEDTLQRQSWPFLALNTGIVAVLLLLSAVLYKNEVPYPSILGILALCGMASWQAFDRTRQGILLAALSAIAAPISELVIINIFGLWQYPHPDIFGPGGVPSWIICCYFFYTPAVGNIARLLNKSS